MDLLDKPKQFPTIRQMAAQARAPLEALQVGETVKYETLTEAIGWDSQSTRGRSAVLMACRALLHDDRKLMYCNVRGIGYQLVPQSEHKRVAESRQGAARRDLHRALEACVHTILGAMTPAEANATLMEEVRIRIKLGVDRRLTKAKALPAKEQVALPTGERLVAMFTRESKAKTA